jgi:hypothetical protein
MTRTLLVLALACLSGPSLAQAIDANGSQTQRLDLLKGSVSMEVESSGALAIGNGEAAGGGSLTVRVNEAPIVDLDGGTSLDPLVDPPAGPVPAAGSDAAPIGGAAPVSSADGACSNSILDPTEWQRAVAEGYSVQLVTASCSIPSAGLAEWMVSEETLQRLLAEQGVDANRVVAITIDDSLVRIHLAD